MTYGVAKELGKIICPLAGQSPHYLKSTQHFIQHIKEVKLEPWEVMASYNVKALFTSIPMDPSINIVKQKLQQDPLLSQKTNMSLQQIVTLLEFCLKTLTSSSRVSIRKRSIAAMGSSISPPSLPTCSWKSTKSRPLVLPDTPHAYS